MLDGEYIANRINELCEKQDISKYQLAKQSGLAESSISNLLNRSSDARCSTISRVCEGFGITMAQFFQDDDKRCDLNIEQQHILNVWESLSKEEKRLVEAYIDGIKRRKQP